MKTGKVEQPTTTSTTQPNLLRLHAKWTQETPKVPCVVLAPPHKFPSKFPESLHLSFCLPLFRARRACRRWPSPQATCPSPKVPLASFTPPVGTSTGRQSFTDLCEEGPAPSLSSARRSPRPPPGLTSPRSTSPQAGRAAALILPPSTSAQAISFRSPGPGTPFTLSPSSIRDSRTTSSCIDARTAR